MRVSVQNVEIKDLTPKVPAEFKSLVPTRLRPSQMSFEVSPVPAAVSNAIRRTIACELLVMRLYVEYEDIETTDRFILPEMITKRFKMVPIDQTTPPNTRFELVASNDSAVVRDVKTSEMRIVGGGRLPFNDQFTLFTLQPKTTVRITNITLKSSYGYVHKDGMYAMVCNAVSVVVGANPRNEYERSGESVSVSNPQRWRIGFISNGELPPKEIVARACDSIIERSKYVKTLLDFIENDRDEYMLHIAGESHTIGNLFMRIICDKFPNIGAVTYATDHVGRSCTIKVRCDEDIADVFNTAIKEITRVFTDIKAGV